MRLSAAVIAIVFVSGVPAPGATADDPGVAPRAVDGLDDDWPGEPTMVPGTAGYDAGVWSFTDYPYDDRGTGSFAYPAEGEYGNNAADVVVLQVALGEDAVHYLVRLNTLIEPDTTVIALAVDVDGDEDTGGGTWPLNAKATTAGWEFVFNAWGTAGSVTTHNGEVFEIPVAADTELNHIEFAVPYGIADPGQGTWRYRGGVGVWDAEAGQWAEVVGSSQLAPATAPTGKSDPDQPNIFNLLFRNRTWDGGTSQTDENPSGGFQFARQSEALAAGNLGAFFRDVDFGLLRSGATVRTPEPTDDHNFTRVYATQGWPNDLPEGVSGSGVGNFLYNGRYHPYILFVPAEYWEGLPAPAPVVPLLHGWRGNHRGFNPSGNSFWNDVVRGHRMLVPKPLGRGEEIWYEHVGELDVLEIIADVAHHYEVDLDRVYLAGVSMGGLGTIKIAQQHPEVFAGIWPSVPPMSDRAQGYVLPQNNDWDLVELSASLRNVPVRNFFGTVDALVPAGIDPGRFCDRLFELVYDHDCWRAVTGGHSNYDAARSAEIVQLLTEHPRRVEDPARVTYLSHPAFRRQAAEAGVEDLLSYDSAYWIGGLEWPEPPADDNPVPSWPTDPGTLRRLIFGEGISSIDVRTYGRGEGDPVAEEIPDDPSPLTVRSGWVLRPGPGVEPRNHFDLTWEGVVAADLDLERMGLQLNPAKPLTADLTRTSTGLAWALTAQPPLSLGLLGAPPPAVGCTATVDGLQVPVERDGRRLVVELDVEGGELRVDCGR